MNHSGGKGEATSLRNMSAMTLTAVGNMCRKKFTTNFFVRV